MTSAPDPDPPDPDPQRDAWVDMLRAHAAEWPEGSEAHRRRAAAAATVAAVGLAGAAAAMRCDARYLLDLANDIDAYTETRP